MGTYWTSQQNAVRTGSVQGKNSACFIDGRGITTKINDEKERG